MRDGDLLAPLPQGILSGLLSLRKARRRIAALDVMHFNQVFLITASVVGSLALPSSLRSDQHTSGSATSKGTSSSQRWFLPAEWHLPGAVTAAALATAGVVTALQESQSKANLPTEDGRGGTARGGDTATVQEGMRRSTEEMTRRPISEGSSENLRQLDLAQRILDIARDDPHGHDWIFRCAKIHVSGIGRTITKPCLFFGLSRHTVVERSS